MGVAVGRGEVGTAYAPVPSTAEDALRERLHIAARALVAALQADGRRFDRKILRWNDLVETALGYGALGAGSAERLEAVCRAGLVEAVECCELGSAFYIKGRGPLTMLAPFRGHLVAGCRDASMMKGVQG